jgi:hypothetical protein
MEDNALYGITWAADGKGFFVTSEKPGSFSLLHVTLAGKEQALLRYEAVIKQVIYNPTPSSDGKYLAFEVGSYDSNVWMIGNF